jgi:hypothetical protein
MVVFMKSQVPVSTSVRSLVKGFVLTQRTDCKSPRTIEYYESNLRRFLWYAEQQEWPDDVCLITEWHIREFLAYTGGEGKLTLASADGFRLAMLVASNRANEQQRADNEAKGEAEPIAEDIAEPTAEVQSEPTEAEVAEAVAEAEATAKAEAKPRRSRSRKKEPVALA